MDCFGQILRWHKYTGNSWIIIVSLQITQRVIIVITIIIIIDNEILPVRENVKNGFLYVH